MFQGFSAMIVGFLSEQACVATEWRAQKGKEKEEFMEAY